MTNNHPNRRISALDRKLLAFAVSNRFFDETDGRHCEMFPRYDVAIPRLVARGLLESVDVGGVHVYHATTAGEQFAAKR